MNLANLTNKKRTEYEQMLSSGERLKGFREDEIFLLAMKGMIWNLYLSETSEAVIALRQSAVQSPLPELQEEIITALDLLAQRANEDARIAMYDLAVSFKNQRAVNRITKNQYVASIPALNVVFEFLYGTKEKFMALDPDMIQLTDWILNSPYKELQNRSREHAHKIGLENWSILMKAVLLNTPDDYQLVLQTYPRFNNIEVGLLEKVLYSQAVKDNQLARDTICELFIQYDAWMFRELAVDHHYQIADPIQNALFLFLSEQWAEYEAVDFNHSFISSAYQNADESLRKRILAHSRYTGHTDWLKQIQATTPTRQVNEMNDADWDHAIQDLIQTKQWDELWQLAQYAPPIFSVEILHTLAEAEWHPDLSPALNQYDQLIALAQDCWQTPLDLPDHTAQQTSEQITCLAISPDQEYAAIGFNSNAIQIWKIGTANYLDHTIQTVAAQTRTLAFSPDNTFLAAACGDNKIRIFKTDNYQNIQTFAGHKGFIRSLQFSQDSYSLYSAGLDKSILAWRFPQGSLRWTKTLKSELFSLELAANTNSLISSGGDNQIQIWNLPDGENRRNLTQDAEIIPVLAISANGQLLASFNNRKILQIWNYISGKLLLEKEVTDLTITQMKFSQDERLLVVATVDGQIRLISPSTGKEINSWKIDKGPITGIALTGDDTTLISTHAHGRLSFWNLETMKLARIPLKVNVSETNKAISEKLNHQLPKSEKQWLRFILEIIRWNQRFDIGISAIHEIQTSSFEIHL